MSEIKVERLIKGILVREGAGVKLHRYIGIERTNDFEPFLLLDYFNSAEPLDYMAGFPAHPHRGFETITYLLEGSITHEDNKGHKGVISAGDVQWMTAGKGIIHSEMPSANGRLHGFQLWLNLPASEKMTAPRYQEMQSSQLPVEIHECGGQIKVIAGQTDKGTASPISGIATRPLLFDIILPPAAGIQQHIPNDYQAILFVVSGTVRIGEQLVQHETLAKLGAGDVLQLKSETASQCILIAAARIHEPITRHGPFVMNTQEEIIQAMDDFRSGRF
ncbi:pirin family protein [Fluoribacter dumoffii]|uniref:Quercetin 2,3-dioxygenase n=1 Tax=Fluoribacter dumoffii TaxID=463 RepID=A0A377G630_9GAMM|nr:pirin family protein [Fluoribacter dumoffii]KTC91506.1 pirin-like protein [Fluoribacter dumoffii NY 23]MCW8387370.1 pirin family protein [Fluoribacter dumoffii]MCW8417123.1 pirin family protein [Fluoribacter dumoffii]MCW8455037.1 pirin family protein [Fluoribacter dumoffii]MCW8460886.1 pirin family protein [Fluoribacter dumoffii]